MKQIRATSEDKSYSFMSNEIPGGQNNPINYAENWFEAISKLDQASKSGWMEWKDFRNAMYALGELAPLTANGIKIGDEIVTNTA